MTAELFVALLVLGPVLGAGVTVVMPAGAVRLATSVATAGVQVVAALALVGATLDGARVVVDVCGHAAPLGITLAVDPLAAIAAFVAGLVVLAVQVGLIGTAPDRWPMTRPALLLLSAGVMLSFTTTDLFTLFVSFEVVLIASYVLMTRDGDRRGVRAAPTYVAVNLLASAVFLLAIAGVYAATGHVNLAAIAAEWSEVPQATRLLLGGLLMVVFSIKAALVPLGVWLPSAYAAVPPILGAAFAALLTKVGVVALLRVVTLLDVRTGQGPDPLLLAIACATMLGGVLVAFGERELHRILAAHVVSQVGFMILGLALLDVSGLAGAVLYLAHHVVVKGALLLVAAVVLARGATMSLSRLGGLGRSAPVLAVTFGVAAIALAGLPPTSGFVAKFALLRAGVDAGAWVAVGVALLASLLTMASMAKVHLGVFRAERPNGTHHATHHAAHDAAHDGVTGTAVGTSGVALRAGRPALVAAMGLAAIGLLGAALAGPMHALSVVAAEALLDKGAYIQAVLR